MDSAWDGMLDLIEQHATDPSRPTGPELEETLAGLVTDAMAARDIDSELHVPDVTRWLVGLVHAHRAVRAAHPEVHPHDDLSGLRVIATRWLHPARPR